MNLRNRREHDVFLWLVLLDFLTWLTLEIADGVVHNTFPSEYFNLLEVYPQMIEQISTSFGVSKSCILPQNSNARRSSRSKSLPVLFSGANCVLFARETNPPLVRSEIGSINGWNCFVPSITMLPWIIVGDINGPIPLIRSRRMSLPVPHPWVLCTRLRCP